MYSPVRAIIRSLAAVTLMGGILGFVCPPDAPAAPATHGPLGATPQEITDRYGPVLVHNARVRHHQIIVGGSVLDGDLHGKNGMVVRVVYHQSRSVLLEFTPTAAKLTADDINTLLASCAGDSTWEMGKDSTDASKYYHRTDGKAVAHWAVEDASLLVASEGDNPTSDLMDRLAQ